jgi:hypothetical protein
VAFVCPGSLSDVSVYRNLLFVSSEATSGRLGALTRLAAELDRDAPGARDAVKVGMLAGAVRELAGAPR